MRLVGKQLQSSLPIFAPACILFCFLSLSLLSPVWTETKLLQRELQRSTLVRLSSSRLTLSLCRRSFVSRGETDRKARTANQLIPTSPVAKKHSVDRQSGQRVQKASLIGQIERKWLDFYQSWIQRHVETQRSCDTHSPCHFLIAVYGIMIFS